MRTSLREEPFVLLDTLWTVRKPITHVTHYQGALWSGMWRFAYNPYLVDYRDFHKVGFIPMPADFGVESYAQGDQLHCGLLLPQAELPRFTQVIAGLRSQPDTHGQFEPGNTLDLDAITCRRSGKSWPQHTAQPIHADDLMDAAQALAQRDHFTLYFHHPLRFTLPAGEKSPGHHFCTPRWFQNHAAPLQHILRDVLPAESLAKLQLADHVGWWQTVKYGRPGPSKRLGGFVGWLRIAGRLTVPEAHELVRHQWLGLGKNRAFGLGLYTIPEIAHRLPLQPLQQQRTLWQTTQRRIARRWDPVSGQPRLSDHRNSRVDQPLTDAAILHQAALSCRLPILRSIGPPRNPAMGRGLHRAVGLQLTVDWSQFDAAKWLSLIPCLFPHDPITALLTQAKLGAVADGEHPLAPLLDVMLRGVLAQHFPDSAIHLPGTPWHLVLTGCGASERQQAIRHIYQALPNLPILAIHSEILNPTRHFKSKKPAA